VAVLPFSASTLAELLVVADYGNDRLLLVQASPRDGSGGELLLSLLGPPLAVPNRRESRDKPWTHGLAAYAGQEAVGQPTRAAWNSSIEEHVEPRNSVQG
jgi:hypothetical protein